MQSLLLDRYIAAPLRSGYPHSQNVSHCISLSGYLLDVIVISGIPVCRFDGSEGAKQWSPEADASQMPPAQAGARKGGPATRMIDWEMP